MLRFWDELSRTERDNFVQEIHRRFCLHCSRVGKSGFKPHSDHKCSSEGIVAFESAIGFHECNICKKLSLTAAQTYSHSARSHGYIKMETCPLKACGRSYYHHTPFLRHIQRFHGGLHSFLTLINKELGPTIPWNGLVELA